VIEAVGRLNVETVCFWNADACVKLLVTKILSCTAVRIVDVSPGSSLFREFDETRDFQRRIAYSESDYTSRLHAFVCKCYAAKSSPRLMERQDKVVVIPNGVPTAKAANTRQTSAAPAMSIGTCARIAPENRIEFLIESFAIVAQRFEAASLTIVGEAQAGRTRYKESLLRRVTELGLKQVHFAGATENVSPWLRSFRVFVTAFGGEGCPNAVLEAMAAGTPVVATASPSNEELVRSGVNGFIVSDTDPHDMAAKIEVLFTRPEVTDSMGRASELTARQNFSMQRMVDSYRSLLAC